MRVGRNSGVVVASKRWSVARSIVLVDHDWLPGFNATVRSIAFVLLYHLIEAVQQADAGIGFYARLRHNMLSSTAVGNARYERKTPAEDLPRTTSSALFRRSLR